MNQSIEKERLRETCKIGFFSILLSGIMLKPRHKARSAGHCQTREEKETDEMEKTETERNRRNKGRRVRQRFLGEGRPKREGRGLSPPPQIGLKLCRAVGPYIHTFLLCVFRWFYKRYMGAHSILFLATQRKNNIFFSKTRV
uniref:Uncharacterized protein n=1 Tax=Treubia lacunosa TaxID=93845 RepID=G4Y9Q6_9MARC|nr:hypothetical protein TrlaMp07 [Treubia lacunosa]AEH99702.1 hypothetical protein TrlaMp07 [Treubia lacunosa]